MMMAPFLLQAVQLLLDICKLGRSIMVIMTRKMDTLLPIIDFIIMGNNGSIIIVGDNDVITGVLIRNNDVIMM